MFGQQDQDKEKDEATALLEAEAAKAKGAEEQSEFQVWLKADGESEITLNRLEATEKKALSMGWTKK